jgi:hypothetical protein
MGCQNAKISENDSEIVSDKKIFRTRFEGILYKLKTLKMRAISIQDRKSVEDVEW